MKAINKSQSGAVLVISLIMLLALTLIGITSSNVTGLEEKMVANAKDINLAFQAAEATLRYVETTQLKTKPAFERTTADAQQGINGLYTTMKNCTSTNSSDNQRSTVDPIDPLYDATKHPFYEKVDWYAAGTNAKYKTYDIGTGSNKKLAGVSRNPEYIIEEVNCIAMTDASGSSASLEAGKQQTKQLGEIITMRITAHAWGSTNGVVNLQSTVRMIYKN